MTAIPWTKARLWPKELEGSWVWQWNKYGEQQPTKVWVPIGLKRDRATCWGKWFASLDFDHVAASQKSLPRVDDLQFINFHGGDFLILHFSAESILKYPQLVEKVMSARISVPDNIAVLTFATNNIAQQALLLRQLDRCEIGYRNLAGAFPSDQTWYGRCKFKGLVDVLPKIEQEHALILDGSDVLLFQSLDSIVDRFNAYGKQIVFGAQRPKWPKIDIPGEDDNEYGMYRYLSSGTVFGRTQALTSFFKRALDVQQENSKIFSDQLLCRMVFSERRDSVELDHRRSLFQNVGLIKYDGGNCLRFW